jgi:hypothetical protein
MSEHPKDVKDLAGEELIQWAKSRTPLFTDSVEFDGMSLCYVNPELVEEEVDPTEKQATPPHEAQGQV